MLIACNVDNSHFPGLANELPNHQGTPQYSVPGSGGAGSTTTTTTTASDAGPALTVCDCVAAYTAGVDGCTTCGNTACSVQYTACQSAADCDDAIGCAFDCGDDGACIAGCLAMYPDYAAFANCLFQGGCAASCGVSPPLTCPLSDGGADGSADAATD